MRAPLEQLQKLLLGDLSILIGIDRVHDSFNFLLVHRLLIILNFEDVPDNMHELIHLQRPVSIHIVSFEDLVDCLFHNVLG